MLDKTPIRLDHFGGLRVTDLYGSYAPRNADIVPLDCALVADNVHFMKSGGLRTRDGFQSLLDVHPTGFTGDVVQYWQIKNLNGVEYSNRWLVLTWDGADGNMYDTGVVGPATNPILTVQGMKYAFVINAFNRMYISPWSDWGVPLVTTTTQIPAVTGLFANNILVYNGLYNARIAQLLPPSNTIVVATSATAGNVTAGLHLLDVAFETDSGYIIGSVVFGAPSSVVSYTAPGAFCIDVSVIPVGPVGTVARHLIMTKIIAAYDGQGFATNEPFFITRIPDNTTVAITGLNVPDSGLVESAAYLLDRTINIKSCVSMSVYSNRMVYNGIRPTAGLASDVQNTSSILVSPPGLPEDVNHFGNDGSKVLIHPEYTGRVMNGAELRGVYYIGKEDSFFATQESEGLDPNEWTVTLIDSGVGIFPLGITNVTDNPGSLVLDNLLVAGPSGIHRFTGSFDPTPISRGWYDLYTIAQLKYSQLWCDPVRKLLFVNFNNPLDPGRFFMCGNYYEGFTDEAIRWSRYVLPAADTEWSGEIPWFALYVDSAVAYPVPVLGYKTVNNGHFALIKEIPSALYDFVSTHISWEYVTGFTPNENGELLTFAFIRARCTNNSGISTAPFTDFEYAELDSDTLIPIGSINPGTDPKKYYTLPMNFVGEQVRFRLSGTHGNILTRLIIFVSERAKDRER